MINKISRYCMPSLNSLLFGDDNLNHNSNSELFLAVQKFNCLLSKHTQSLRNKIVIENNCIAWLCWCSALPCPALPCPVLLCPPLPCSTPLYPLHPPLTRPSIPSPLTPSPPMYPTISFPLPYRTSLPFALPCLTSLHSTPLHHPLPFTIPYPALLPSSPHPTPPHATHPSPLTYPTLPYPALHHSTLPSPPFTYPTPLYSTIPPHPISSAH